MDAKYLSNLDESIRDLEQSRCVLRRSSAELAAVLEQINQSVSDVDRRLQEARRLRAEASGLGSAC